LSFPVDIMEAWEQKIVDEGVDYIKNKLGEDQAYLEKLIADGPATTLDEAMRKADEAMCKQNARLHVLMRMVDVRREHVTTVDTSKSHVLDVAIQRLMDYATSTVSADEVNFSRLQAKGELDPERSRLIETMYIHFWHNKLRVCLSHVVNLRHFFKQHLSDFMVPASVKKSSLHY
jgi:hypothetical protein